MSLETRVRDTLRSVAEAVPEADPLAVTQVQRRGRRRRLVRRSWMGAGALAIVGMTVWLASSRPGVPLADGEELLARDPPVVAGVPGPAPAFMTLSLGADVSLTPVTDLAAVVALAEEVARGEDILRITALGSTPGGSPVIVVHYETEMPQVGDLQVRCVATESGSGCAGELSETMEGRLLGPSPGGLGGYETGPGVLVWEASPDTSVVMLTVNGERRWTRPVSGVAVFETELSDDDGFFITAFDADGRVLDTLRQSLTTGGPSSEFSCPITFPWPDGFVPPSPYPPTPRPGDAWFGRAELWTVLPIDGAYERRKSVWWSVNFPGGELEGQPEIGVTYERLDADREPIVDPAPGTNAFTPEDGWFMIASIDPDEPGCWRVTVTYKGATVSYVYEIGAD